MENKQNIFITNFWYAVNNYGANLTAFALQQILNSYGNSVLIDNSDKFEERKDRKISFSYDFKKQNLIYSKYVSKISDIKTLDFKVNTYVTGSDQVFRPIYTRGKLEQYLLDFVEPDKKKIAFSASFGVNKKQFLKENSQDIIEHIKNSLQSFDFISVREKSGVEICKDLFDVKAEWIIDPVFILDKSKYDELIENITPHPNPLPKGAREKTCLYKNKIVAYVLDTNDEYKKAYKYLEKKYNKKVIETANSNISVESWLKSIRDCDLFVTDSFHGMCYALIFNKPFICLANKDRGATRFDSICEMLGIENQCIDSITEVTQKDCVFKIDYEGVNRRIEHERQRGLDFLQKALEAPVTKTQEKIDVRMEYLEQRVCELEEQNNLSYQFKKYIWEKWLVIYYGYLPTPIKNIIHLFWQMIKGAKNASRK